MGRTPAGFTLIELMVTIAVIGIIAAIALPNLSNYLDRQRLVGQMRAIANLARLARSEAIKHSAGGPAALKTVSLTVSPASPWYVGASNGLSPCSGTECVLNEAGVAVSHTVSSTECPDCTMSSPGVQAVITFDLRGLATGSVEREITLQSPMGKALSLRIGRLGSMSLCTPGGSVSGYATC